MKAKHTKKYPNLTACINFFKHCYKLFEIFKSHISYSNNYKATGQKKKSHMNT